MKKDNIENTIPDSLNYIGDLIIGPSISAVLDKVIIKNPSEQLIAFIYFLGFFLSVFKIWQSVKTRKIRFLEKMVFMKQSKNGEETERGIIDENSVKMAESIAKL